MGFREELDAVDIFREHKLHCLKPIDFSIERRFGKYCIDFFCIFPTIQETNGTRYKNLILTFELQLKFENLLIHLETQVL